MKNNNFMMLLAGFLVVALGIMGYVIYNQNKVLESLDRETLKLNTQSSSDDTAEIQNDLEDTNLNDLDKELIDIEAELNSPN
jgi:Tfp pilus assembly protein PilO